MDFWLSFFYFWSNWADFLIWWCKCVLVSGTKVSSLNSSSFLLNFFLLTSFLLASFLGFLQPLKIIWSIWVSKNSSSSTEDTYWWLKKTPLPLPPKLLPLSLPPKTYFWDFCHLIWSRKLQKEARRKEFRRKEEELKLDTLVPENSTHLHHHIKTRPSSDSEAATMYKLKG